MIQGASNAAYTAVCRELSEPYALRYLSVPGREAEAIAAAPSICPTGYELLRVIVRGNFHGIVWTAEEKANQPAN